MKKSIRRASAALAGVILCLLLLAPFGGVTIQSKAANSLDSLRSAFPQGTYWNHAGTSYNTYKANRTAYNLKSTTTPCNHYEYSSKGTHCSYGSFNYSGECGCNSYDGSTQCMGFARFVGNYLFGQAPNGGGSEGNGWSRTNFNSLRPGDYIRYKKTSSHYGHSVIVASKSSSSITVLECNSDGKCGISWTRSISKSTLDGYYSVNYLTHGGIIIDEPKIDTRYPTPFIARTISTGKVVCYSDVNGSSVGKIYPEDDVTIQAVYTNGWVKGSCPWSGGTYKTIYVPRSVFIGSANAPQKYTATQKTYTYLRSSDSSSWGWIDPGDTCYSICKSGSRTMVIYPTSNGSRRLAWTTNAVPTYQLDLNSSVNGSKVWDLKGIGTADVYINNKLVANDCSDFCQSFARGTTYKITDIRAKSGYTYTGASTISGTLNGNRDITLPFRKAVTYTLDLNSSVDGTKVWDLNGVGTADVYIDNKLVADDCRDFCQSIERGKPYKITDIRANSGYTYTGAKTISGTMNGNRDITLTFKKEAEPGFSTNFRMKAGAYMNAYDGVNGSKVGRVYPNDVVTVQYVYNSGWMKLSCPWDGGYNKTVFCQVNGFQYKSTKYCNAYDGINGNYVGRVYPNDLVTVKTLYSSGWMKCVCPWDGGYNKTIFVKVGEIY